MLAVPMDDDDTRTIAVGAPLRWQSHFYRSYLTHALKKLANDPNPDVQRIGQDMDRCLNCPNSERCSNCPFGHGGKARLHRPL
jgi:hypothetical protein